MNLENIDGVLLKKMILYAAKNLENNKQLVNDLNVFPVPDGDTGTNMSLTIQFAAKEIAKLPDNNLYKIADAASKGSLMGARGNSGVILSQLFRGFAKGCKGKETLDVHSLSEALKSGADMAYKAVMKPTEGTILTVARESADYAIKNAKNYKDMDIFINKIIDWANITLSKTPDMLSVLKEAGVVDAGGKGLVLILEGAYKALFEDDFITEEEHTNIERFKVEDTLKDHLSTADIKFAYCTEFIIFGNDNSENTLKKQLAEIGDSLMVVGDDDRIKVHVHTNSPGKALEYALQVGELSSIKIDNMKEQHRNNLSFKGVDNNEDIEQDYSFIAVVSGEGMAKIYQDLGVENIIRGGQTMNPSTEDFLKELEKIQAKHIYILPNNSNIFLAAEQAKQISEKSIDVLTTRTIPQGISALLSFNSEHSKEINYKDMQDAIKKVKTGQITFAVRDTQFNGMKIEKDDIIGILDGEIVSVGQKINDVSIDLLKKMVSKEDELITIYTGENILKKENDEMIGKIENVFRDLDVEVHQGDQPLYYYIISVE